MKNENPVDCFKCRYFYVTWDAGRPRGCKAFGFKTEKMPSVIVFENSGADCLKYSPKNPPEQKKKKRGWIA